MAALFIAENKTVVVLRNGTEQGRRFIRGTVILHQHGKIPVCLGGKRFQQYREMIASVVGGQ